MIIIWKLNTQQLYLIEKGRERARVCADLQVLGSSVLIVIILDNKTNQNTPGQDLLEE